MKKLILISITVLSFKPSFSMESTKNTVNTIRNEICKSKDLLISTAVDTLKKTIPVINASMPSKDDVTKEFDSDIIKRSRTVITPYAGAIGKKVLDYKNNNLDIKETIFNATRKPRGWIPPVVVLYVMSKNLGKNLD